jgi:hypothetical protein
VERTTWTDERLSDSFQLLRADLGELHADMRELRNEMRNFRTEMREELREIHRQLFVGAMGMVVALIGVLGGIVATA